MSDGEIVVGVTDPGDVVALDDVRAATGMTVRPVVVARSEVRRIIERLQRESSDLGEMVEDESESQGAMSAQATSVDDAPIVRYVNNLIEQGGHEPGLRPAPRADRGRHAGALPHRRACCTRSTWSRAAS